MKREIKKADAYFTVEAALVMPFVIIIIFLTIYLLIFQYDRCLMEQGVGVMALRGCSLQIKSSEELVRELVRQSANDDRAYAAWSMEDLTVIIRGRQIVIQRSGELRFPISGIVFWRVGELWGSKAVYKSYRIAPVSFIRDYRKLMGGK